MVGTRTRPAEASDTPPAVDALAPVSAPAGGDRPRLLSYVGRWGRARRWVVGVEPDSRHISAAGRWFPCRGLLAPLDPMNVYPRLQRRFPSWLPLESAEESRTGVHCHFSVDEVTCLLGPGFAMDRTARSGVGVSEILCLAMLVVAKGLLRRDRLLKVLLPAHMIVYIVDDLIPLGRFRYHLMLRARVLGPAPLGGTLTRLDPPLSDAGLEPS